MVLVMLNVLIDRCPEKTQRDADQCERNRYEYAAQGVLRHIEVIEAVDDHRKQRLEDEHREFIPQHDVEGVSAYVGGKAEEAIVSCGGDLRYSRLPATNILRVSKAGRTWICEIV